MSRRQSIINALANKFKEIDGSAGYKTNLYGNAYPYLKFWDEVQDYPSVYMVCGTELREYHPSDFTWGFLSVSIKIYTKGENSSQMLEDVLDDLEKVINSNRRLDYDLTNQLSTEEILITSISTDEGLLYPYSVGEINIQVRYQIV